MSLPMQTWQVANTLIMDSSTNLQGLLGTGDIYKTFGTVPSELQILLLQLSVHAIE